MLGRLLKSLFGPGPVPGPEVTDDVLGILRPDPESDGGWFTATLRLADQEVRFDIGTIEVEGKLVPDPVLIVAAKEIVAEFAPFNERVMVFLQHNGGPHEKYTKLYTEAKSLVIESVFLPWSKKPREGMICFDCPTENEGRAWRCGMVDRVPQHLGFDS